MVTTVLIDVGGVILADEKPFGDYLDMLKSALRDAGIPVTDDEYAEAVRLSILSFVPSTAKAVAWRFTKPDAERCSKIVRGFRAAAADWAKTLPRKLCSGAEGALGSLSSSHALALAGNAPSHIRQVLDRLGVLCHFTHTEVSEDLGVSKPDLRFFQQILDRCGVSAEKAVMVGDRLDNDIIPAKMLGMRTIHVKAGHFAILEPRTPDEMPDVTVASIGELPAAVASLQE